MKPETLQFKGLTIPVFFFSTNKATLESLRALFHHMEFNLDFRRKLKKISTIEMVGDVAIFKYHDGTKLYLEVC